MKRIDIVVAQSKNESRDSLISGYCPHHFIKGIGTIESDCDVISCGTCWNRDDDDKSEIKFAVPPSGENEPVVDKINELKKEVFGLFDTVDSEIKDLYCKDKFLDILVKLNDSYRKGIVKIFEKY